MPTTSPTSGEASSGTPPPMRPDRRWSPIQTLTGVVVGLLLAGVVVPMLVDNPRPRSTAQLSASSPVDGATAEPGPARSDARATQTTLSTTIPAAGGLVASAGNNNTAGAARANAG